jgi:outer membrane receptor for ferrienterochelin and colicins
MLGSTNNLVSSTEVSVRGQVTEKNGKGIPGATIRISNTVLGSVANVDGNFNVKRVQSGNVKFLISAVGYRSHEFEVNIQTSEKTFEIGKIMLEESSINTSDIIVTATRSEKIYEDVPVKVSVLDDRIFSSVSAITLNEGLAFRPGLRIENNCQNCGFNQVRINGLDGRYSQILIDSKPIFSALNGVYGLEQIPQNMISRVEIIRGGASTLYGGNAIAGVVNIITKDPDADGVNVEMSQAVLPGNRSDEAFGGSDRTFKISGQLLNNNEKVGVHIHAMNRSRDAWDANDDGFSEIPSIDLTVFGGKINYKPDMFTRIALEYHNINDSRRGGNKFHLQPHLTDVTEMVDHNINAVGLTAERYINSSDKISSYFSYQNTHRDSYYGSGGDENAYGITDNYSLIFGLQYTKAISQFAGEHVFTTGFEYKHDDLKDVSPAYNRAIIQKSDDFGLYLQNDWILSDMFSILSGVRFDKSNFIEDIILSPRLNVLMKLSSNISLRTNFSTGFRAPQVFDEDLHLTQVNGGGMVISNSPDLKSERSISYGASFDHNISSDKVRSSYSLEFFSTNLNNAFVLENTGTNENGDLLLVRVNAENATVRGMTAEFMLEPWDFLNISTGFTYQTSKYSEAIEWSEGVEEGESSTDRMLRTPDLYGFFTISTEITSNMNFSASGVVTGPMLVPHYAGGIGINGLENEDDKLVETSTFVDIHLKVSYQILAQPNLELGFTVGNILNSFQNDFDRGMNSDAGYIYGPTRPRYFALNLKAGI